MRFEVLGPLQVRDGTAVLRIGGPRELKVLAGLLLRSGRLTSRSWLADLVWDDPPATSRAQIANSVAALRRHLPGLKVTAVGDGYRLDLTGHAFDLDEFTGLLTAARHAADPADAERHCRTALDLWRGPVLDGMDGETVRTETRALASDHLACLEQRISLDLERGRHGQVLGELARLTDAHPLRERLITLRLKALVADGQRLDALAVYDDFRRRLADELGLDPSADLRRIHLDLLRSGDEPPVRTTPPPAPRQLPAAVPRFVGRTAAREELDRILDDGPRVVVVSGTPGVGKTALAVHWAHQVSARFPDGQLYVNLQGHHPTEAPMSPQTVVRRFLDALHHEYEVPVDPSAQADLYRSLLSDRQVLIVLDNARTAEQVRPLIPGTPGSLVVVTSRDALPGLAASEGAHLLTLDLLSDEEAAELLASRIGVARTAAEPTTVRTIVSRCARLPLPLVAVAARAATRPTFPLSALAAELDATVDASGTDVAAAFSWSYRALRPDSAALFRVLGMHDAPDLSLAGVASLSGLTVQAVRPVLSDLTTANLLTEHVPGRYQWHDLLRAYAADLAGATDAAATLTTARHRLLDHYLRTAQAAASRLDPVRDRATSPSAPDGVTVAPVPDRRAAQAWFDAEHPSLLVAVHGAAGRGDDTHAWLLAAAMAEHAQRRGYWQDWEAVHRVGLMAAARSGDRLGEVVMHRGLGRVLLTRGDTVSAREHLAESAAGAGRLDLPLTMAITLLDQARLWLLEDDTTAALNHAAEAVEQFGLADHPIGAARALNLLSRIRARRGEYPDAISACSRALTVHDESGYPDLDGTAATLDTLGYVLQRSGDPAGAATTYARAVNLYRQVGADRLDEAATLRRLGDCQAALGDVDAARSAWQDELTILIELNHPDAQTRRRLWE